MSDNNEIKELKNILVDFINDQKVFNEEQKEFNKKIDRKIDKTQYFLEETMSIHAKTFFDEQIRMNNKINFIKSDIGDIQEDVLKTESQIKELQMV